MDKTLYDSPDVLLVDYKNSQNNYRAVNERVPIIDERFVAPKRTVDNQERKALQELDKYIRKEDVEAMKQSGSSDTPSEDKKAEKLLMYLQDNIPVVNKFLGAMPQSASDEEKLAYIIKCLEERADAIDEYNNRPITPAPFLGNEVEEARAKQDEPDVSSRYKRQYSMAPTYRTKGGGRNTVKSYKTRQSPKTVRIKFL